MTPQALEKAMVALGAQMRRLATLEKQVAAYWTAVYFRDAAEADLARTWKGLLLHWIRQVTVSHALQGATSMRGQGLGIMMTEGLGPCVDRRALDCVVLLGRSAAHPACTWLGLLLRLLRQVCCG